jgi:ABC-type sugar transport system substrate-binding protein
MNRPDDYKSDNLSRIAAILTAFGPDNGARNPAEVIAECGIARSTGFKLVREMTRAGLLERRDHGLTALGPTAASFAFAPLGSRYAHLQTEHSHRFAAVPGQRSSRGFEATVWNPDLLEMVDATSFAKQAPWRIGFANASLSNPWRKALFRSVGYAVRVHGAKIRSFEARHANDDPEVQMQQIDELAGQVDLLIVSAAPESSGALSEQLRAKAAEGLPIVALDRRPHDTRPVVSFVTASDATIGRSSAIWLAEHLSGSGRIWMLSGLAGASPALRRQNAALKAFSLFPGIQVDSVEHTGWRADGGSRAIYRLLEEFGAPPDGVWSDSGLQGVGSINAFLEAGLTPPPHTGGDLNQMYKLAIHHSVPFVAVDYPAAMGARAVEVAIDILEGAVVPKRVETPTQIVVPRGCETMSIKADDWAETHVRWDLSDDAVLSQGPSLKLLTEVEKAI